MYATNPSIIEIPEGVVTVKSHAGKALEGVKELKLPSTLENIASGAFSFMESLESLELGANVAYVGEYAFMSAKNCKSLVLNNKLDKIDEGAFSGMRSLEGTVVIPDNTEVLYGAFDYCGSANFQYRGTLYTQDNIKSMYHAYS